MPSPRIPDEIVRRTHTVWIEKGRINAEAARALHIDEKSVRRHLDIAEDRLGLEVDRSKSDLPGYAKRKPKKPEFTVAPIPDDDPRHDGTGDVRLV